MTAWPRRERCPFALVLIAWIWIGGAASAQVPGGPSTTPPALAAVKTVVPIGDVVYVTDASGVVTKGTLVGVGNDTLELSARSDRRSVAAADIRRVQWQQRDSPLNGVLIGAGVGAIPGLYWLAADPNECAGLCPEEYALIGIGAVVGGLIDRAVHRKVTVYGDGVSSAPPTRFAVALHVTRERKGVHLAVMF